MQLENDNKIPVIFYKKCKENHLKVTPQRVAIYDQIINLVNHPTAEQVYKIIAKQYPNISLDTVNRTLLTFAKIGIVRVIEGFGSPRRYDPNLENHHHVHCINCGKILDFYSDKYENISIPKEIDRKFRIYNKRIVLSGICKKCDE